MNRVILSLGSNIDKERNLIKAVNLLRAMTRVVIVSSVYETAALEAPDQPHFFNAAVLILTPFTPVQVKEQIAGAIEEALLRRRVADRNAPRTIDVDIALFNDEVLDYVPGDGRKRHIPDEDLLRTVHAIVPAAEIAPTQIHPETGERLADIASRLMAKVKNKNVIWVRADISLAE